MKSQRIVWTCLAIIAITFGLMSATGVEPEIDPKETTPPTSLNGFAVVELFTSQGCSSCPSADRVLSNIVKEAEEKDQRVYGLSFHVDYWNQLGWFDPYSNPEFSELQSRYTHQLKSQNYTPQMIVNGQHLFVGSDADQAKRWIKAELEREDYNEIGLSIQLDIMEDGKTLRVGYNTSNALDGYLISVALVEPNITTTVPRGENSGRTLHHDNVVRAFHRSGIVDGTSKVLLEIPDDLKKHEASVIAYVQHIRTLEIKAATEFKLQHI